MARTKTVILRTEPETHEQMVARAEAMGISLNEWLNRVAAHALASKGVSVKYVTEVRI